MERTDPLVAAQRAIDSMFPSAAAAFLGGSVLTARRTDYSDLDLVVVVDQLSAPYRETLRTEGWLVELFVHTEDTLAYYWQLDIDSRRPSLIRMCAEGRILSNPDGLAARLQTDAARLLAAGPPALPADQLDYRRYILSDLLDDYLGSRDLSENVFIAAALLVASTELALVAAGSWLATGKWLPRELTSVDPQLAEAMIAAYQTSITQASKEPLERVVRDVLAMVGGPLGEGYKSRGTLPDSP